MSTTPTPSEYMILFRSTEWKKNLSLEEMQGVMDQTLAWFDRLREEGKFKAAQPLLSEGKVISGKNGQAVTDGPFAESKESVGGYLILQVPTMEEALDIAKGWPMLQFGASLELRPLAQECPDFERIRQQAAQTSA